MSRRLSLSDQLRREIDRAKISRYRLAKEIDCTSQLLTRFMHGHGGLSLRTVEKIADVLGLDLVRRKRT